MNKKSKQSTRARGTLAVLAAFLAISAGIRIATSATEAFAAANATNANSALESSPDIGHQIPSKEGLQRLLDAFHEREQKIEEQEIKILERLKYLEATEAKVERQITELKAAEDALRSTLALANSAAENDLAKLTTVYENMKPKTAAALFDEMAPEFAAGFIGRMRPDTAAAILASMNPKVAYMISTIIAGRNTNVPTE